MSENGNIAGQAPSLSVVMSVFNGERFLGDAIESILGQTFEDFEFLILDDGSQDGTAGIIRAYAAADSRIRPIIRENRGLIASLNELISEARAGIVARMDADDIAQADRFAKQWRFLEQHPDHGVVGSWSEDMDEFGAPYANSGADHPVTHDEFLANIDNGGPLMCHPSVMYRRGLVLQQGGYHAAFRHCEDLDLWLRLASVTRLANIPERLIRYRHYSEQVSKKHAIEQQIGAAIARCAYKERAAGRPDPTARLNALPPIKELDALFGHIGVAQHVRGMVARSLLYSPVGMRGEGFDLLLQHIAEGGSHDGLWRTVARLLRFGEPTRAAKLAQALLTAPAGAQAKAA